MKAALVSKEIFFLRTELDRIIIFSILFSGMLVITRTILTGSLLFAFLPWNLFLAYLPYALTNWLETKHNWLTDKVKFFLLLIVWLLFIPNSFYIITDLFHLGLSESAPMWFDLAMILSCAWNGLILGILSVRKMEKMIQLFMGKLDEGLFIYPVMFLNAMGIYIGRYLRFNSWDVVSNPFRLTADIYYLVSSPVKNVSGWGMILCFSFLLSLIYITAKRISKVMK